MPADFNGKRSEGNHRAHRCADRQGNEAGGEEQGGQNESGREHTQRQIYGGLNRADGLGKRRERASEHENPYHVEYAGMSGRF